MDDLDELNNVEKEKLDEGRERNGFERRRVYG